MSVSQQLKSLERNLLLPLFFKVLRIADPNPVWLRPETTKIKVKLLQNDKGLGEYDIVESGIYTAKLVDEPQNSGVRNLILYDSDVNNKEKIVKNDIYIISKYPSIKNSEAILFESLFEFIEDLTPPTSGGAQKKSKKVTRKRSKTKN
jgi:hypothetical protein